MGVGAGAEGDACEQKHSSERAFDERVIKHGEYAEAKHMAEQEGGGDDGDGQYIDFGVGVVPHCGSKISSNLRWQVTGENGCVLRV